MELELEPKSQLSSKRCQSQLCRHQGNGNSDSQTAACHGELHENSLSGRCRGRPQQGECNRRGSLDLFCMWVRAQQCKVPHMQEQEMQEAEPKPYPRARKGHTRTQQRCPKSEWAKHSRPRLIAFFFLLCLLGNQFCSTFSGQQALKQLARSGTNNRDRGRQRRKERRCHGGLRTFACPFTAASADSSSVQADAPRGPPEIWPRVPCLHNPGE